MCAALRMDRATDTPLNLRHFLLKLLFHYRFLSICHTISLQMRLFIIMSDATPAEGAGAMSPLPMTPSTNGGFLSQSQDVTASQPVPAPGGKGGKKDSALKIKLADHCEKKEVEIPLEKLRWDEKMQFGQIRKWSEDEVLNKVEDLKERPPTTLIRIVIWGDGSMLPSVRTVCCFVTNNVRRCWCQHRLSKIAVDFDHL